MQINRTEQVSQTQTQSQKERPQRSNQSCTQQKLWYWYAFTLNILNQSENATLQLSLFYEKELDKKY